MILYTKLQLFDNINAFHKFGYYSYFLHVQKLHPRPSFSFLVNSLFAFLLRFF